MKKKFDDILYSNEELEKDNNRMRTDAENDIKTLEKFNQTKEKLKAIEEKLQNIQSK